MQRHPPTSPLFPYNDALPICRRAKPFRPRRCAGIRSGSDSREHASTPLRRVSMLARSEEHTSELQSRSDLVCRLLLEKKKTDVDQYVEWAVTTAARSNAWRLS